MSEGQFVRISFRLDKAWSSEAATDFLNRGMIPVAYGDRDAVREFAAMPQAERLSVILAGMGTLKTANKPVK